MAVEIKMPQLGLTMTEGTVTSWLKQLGDTVAKGDALLEITTDKLTSEIESETDGVLLAIMAQEGEDVPVQGLLCVIGQAGEHLETAEAAVEAVAFMTEPSEKVLPAKAAVQVNNGRIRISPLARKTAEAMGVSLSGLLGSGPVGRIVQKDVLEAAKNIPSAKAEKEVTIQAVEAPCPADGLMEGDTLVKFMGMRKVVAERMAKSRREIPGVTQNVKVDMTALMAFRKELNSTREQKFSINDFILKAVSKALRQNPYMLVSLDGNNIIKRAHVNLGMAVALDDGLIVPVIKDADKLGLEDLAASAKALASKAREGKLSMEEYKDSTFTISNLGMFGVETFDPIINQPDAAILGVCAISPELALKADGTVYEKQVVRISLTYDHRLIDGATAAKFELAVKELLENPMSILL